MKYRRHGGYRGDLPITPELKEAVTKLRKKGFYVYEICRELELEKNSEMAAVQAICDALPNRWRRGLECGPHNSPHKIRTGSWA
jgi:hypothetical protein